MAQLAMADTATQAGAGLRGVTAPDVAVRLASAMLALAVAAVHIADQGGVTAFTAPGLDRLGLSAHRGGWRGHGAGTAASAGALLGIGPFAAYILSRTVGVPGDPGAAGNWGYWVGTVSLFVEAALMVLSVSMLRALRQSANPAGPRAHIGRPRSGANHMGAPQRTWN